MTDMVVIMYYPEGWSKQSMRPVPQLQTLLDDQVTDTVVIMYSEGKQTLLAR